MKTPNTQQQTTQAKSLRATRTQIGDISTLSRDAADGALAVPLGPRELSTSEINAVAGGWLTSAYVGWRIGTYIDQRWIKPLWN